MLLILRPRVHRPLVLHLDHILKTGINHLLLIPASRIQGDADLDAGLEEQHVPLLRVAVVGEGAVIAVQRAEDVANLDVAARVHVVQGLGEEARPVLDRARHEARVDEVEVVDKVPVGLEVVDEELDVGGDAAGWLGWCCSKQEGVGRRLTRSVGWD